MQTIGTMCQITPAPIIDAELHSIARRNVLQTCPFLSTTLEGGPAFMLTMVWTGASPLWNSVTRDTMLKTGRGKAVRLDASLVRKPARTGVMEALEHAQVFGDRRQRCWAIGSSIRCKPRWGAKHAQDLLRGVFGVHVKA